MVINDVTTDTKAFQSKQEYLCYIHEYIIYIHGGDARDHGLNYVLVSEFC